MLSSAELYDPITSTLSYTGSTTVPRWRHAEARLLNGDVLIVGGTSVGGNGDNAIASAETYSRKLNMSYLWVISGHTKNGLMH